MTLISRLADLQGPDATNLTPEQQAKLDARDVAAKHRPVIVAKVRALMSSLQEKRG